MPDPITLGGLCLGALTAVGGGIVGNRGDAIFCKSVRTLSDEFLSAIKLPENHELLNGVAKAHRQTLADMAMTCDAQARNQLDRMIVDKMTKVAKRAFDCDKEAAMQTAQAMLHGLPALLQSPGDGAASIRRASILAQQCDGVIAWFETETKETLPEHFVALFRSGAPNGRPAWWQVFQIRVSEMIKGEERFERILQATNLAELLGHAVTVELAVFGLRDSMDQVIESLGDVHVKLDGLAEGQAQMKAEIEALKQLLLKQNPANAQQIETFAATAIDLAQSDSATDQSIAREAVKGDPLAASDLLVAEAQNDVTRAAERLRQAARIVAPFNVDKGIAAYARAAALDSSDFMTWRELSRLYKAAGSLLQARQATEAALRLVSNDDDRMIVEIQLGNIAVSEKKLATAAAHYKRALEAAQSLLTSEPSSIKLQSYVSFAYNKIGDVAIVQGDIDAARAAYQIGLEISERLASLDVCNDKMQVDVSVSYERLGNIASAENNFDNAKSLYIQAFQIREKLLISNPHNGDFAVALWASYIKIGDIERLTGNKAASFANYVGAQDISYHLTSSDSSNASYAYYLAISHERLGHIKEDFDDIQDAIVEFGKAENILFQLFTRSGDNPTFKSDYINVLAQSRRLMKSYLLTKIEKTDTK